MKVILSRSEICLQHDFVLTNFRNQEKSKVEKQWSINRAMVSGKPLKIIYSRNQGYVSETFLAFSLCMECRICRVKSKNMKKKMHIFKIMSEFKHVKITTKLKGRITGHAEEQKLNIRCQKVEHKIKELEYMESFLRRKTKGTETIRSCVGRKACTACALH